VLVGMNLVIPRFFCRVMCPLGAFLGFLSRFSLWRIDRDPHKCTDCDLCLKSCEGASDPHTLLRKSECFVCFNCLEDCPHDAISFRFLPDRQREVAGPDVRRRHAIAAVVFGILLYPFARLSGKVSAKTYDRRVVRPPGSVEEEEFLRRCIKCDQCIRVCPTNVLQPAMLEAGVEGLWTPIMDFRAGWCQLNCTLCSQVCPTGAIDRISIGQKLGLEEYRGKTESIVLGTAFYDRGRCLPWAMETPCVVCQEVCPTSPKAIGTYDEEYVRWDGKKVVLNKPYVRPELCIGCGICEHECPVTSSRAVYVTPEGESRSKGTSRERSLLLSLNDRIAPTSRSSHGACGHGTCSCDASPPGAVADAGAAAAIWLNPATGGLEVKS
jgi:ferredoxin